MSEANGQSGSRALLFALVLVVAIEVAFVATTLMSRPAAQSAFDFSLDAIPTSGSVAPGSTVMTTVTATAAYGSTRDVRFSCESLPLGANCSFTPPSCRPTCTANLVLSTSPSTPPGAYDVMIEASGGTISRTTRVPLNLSAPPPSPPPPTPFDFSLDLDPADGSVIPGGEVSASVTTTLVSDPTRVVHFSCSNLPPGTMCTFLPPSCSPTCDATLRLATSASTPVGTYPIHVIASAGSLSRTTLFALTVQGTGPVRTLAFQEGDGGTFSETYDATITNGNPEGNYGADPLVKVDSGTCFAVGEVCRGLLSFPHAIGPNEGQIPLNSTIVSASFVLNVENHGPSQGMDQVLEAWGEAAVTWNSFATPGAPRTKGPTISFDTAWGAFVVNITEIVQNWVDGDPNYGVVLRTDSDDGTHYHSSESSRAPKLTVTFRPVGSAMAVGASLDSPGALLPAPMPRGVNGGSELVWEMAPGALAIPAARRNRA